MEKATKPVKKTKKIGLIIQGPLVSIGKTGQTLNISPKDFKKEKLARFDCRQNIKRVITDFKKLFDAVVISTWDNELKPSDRWSGAKIISAPDPGGRGYGSYKANNLYRQFIGIRNGLIKMREVADVDYVVRIRTDQYLDLQELLNSFYRYLNRKNYYSEIICVPSHELPFHQLMDFYFASKPQAMKKFCDAILAYNKYEFSKNIHYEMVLKPAFVLYRNVIGVPDWAYFPKNCPADGLGNITKEIFYFMLSRVFAPLSFSVIKSIIWRGTPLCDIYLQRCLLTSNHPVLVEENIYSFAGAKEKRLNIREPLGLPKFKSSVSAGINKDKDFIDWDKYKDFVTKFNIKPCH